MNIHNPFINLVDPVCVDSVTTLSRCPIARSFDGLTDWLEYRMENWAVGAHDEGIVDYFEELDGNGWSLTCQTRLDGFSISIVVRTVLWNKYNKNHMISVGQWERNIVWNLSKT